MFYRLKDKLRRLRFARASRFILASPRVAVSPGSAVALFTQLQHKDVLLALCALKSFTLRVPVGAFHILNDGSLSAADLALLDAHFENLVFHDMAAARSEACPVGGCWERLLTIAELVKTHYVIQLDSDTLTLDALPEIIDCIDANRSFVIGTWDDQDFESMAARAEMAARVKAENKTQTHIQLLAESSFKQLDGFEALRYVRGCAGFSGFGRGSFERGFVESISRQMLTILGDRWREWGSEQVMSNIVVANSAINAVLPHPRYCDCTRIQPGTTAFVHFIGACRFDGGVYADHARRVLDKSAA
jgi:hypothetical protein